MTGSVVDEIEVLAGLHDRLKGLDADELGVADETVQDAIAAGVRLYALALQRRPDLQAFDVRHDITPTDVVILAGALLKAADLDVFELAMWQVWGGQ